LSTFSYLCKEFNSGFLRILSISSFGSKIYCNFSIDRSFKDKQIENNYGVFGNDFIAVKNITTKEDMLSIMDISTYEQFYFFSDDFEFESNLYSTGVWLY